MKELQGRIAPVSGQKEKSPRQKKIERKRCRNYHATGKKSLKSVKKKHFGVAGREIDTKTDFHQSTDLRVGYHAPGRKCHWSSTKNAPPKMRRE